MRKPKFLQLLLAVCISLFLALPPFTAQGKFSQAALTVNEADKPGEIETARLQGHITDRATGLPISDARVTVSGLDEGFGSGDQPLAANAGGLFDKTDLLLPQAVLPVTVTISAPGYGDWTLQNVRLIAGDTLILKARLSPEPYLDIVPPPHAERLPQVDGLPEIASAEPFFSATERLVLEPLPLNHVTVPRPEYIRVRVSGYPYDCDTSRDYTVEVVPFNQYAKNVLPNEWGATWPADSLRAGAMAVKMYAWSVLSLGYKWSDADVWDSTCDQVYNPNFEYTSTNDAVDAIWDWVLGKDDLIFHTSYRAYYSQCVDANKEGRCMGQYDSKDMALDGATWEEILYFFYLDSELLLTTPRAADGYQLRFNGSEGDNTTNRVLIQVDDPEDPDPGPPADVGANDFTIEWWLKGSAAENTAPAVVCGANDHWQNGNLLLDRTRAGQDRGYGVSLAGGRVVFGISGEGSGDFSLCGATTVSDDQWHHIAVERRRSDGLLWLYVDGQLDASAAGPTGDISYPDDYESDQSTDPFLAIAAWKLPDEADTHPFFNGWLDELRLSSRLRYVADFPRPLLPFTPDEFSLALYHFDEGVGNLVFDSAGGLDSANQGNRKYGGTVDGPVWESATPLLALEPGAFLPLLR